MEGEAWTLESSEATDITSCMQGERKIDRGRKRQGRRKERRDVGIGQRNNET